MPNSAEMLLAGHSTASYMDLEVTKDTCCGFVTCWPGGSAHGAYLQHLLDGLQHNTLLGCQLFNILQEAKGHEDEVLNGCLPSTTNTACSSVSGQRGLTLMQHLEYKDIC